MPEPEWLLKAIEDARREGRILSETGVKPAPVPAPPAARRKPARSWAELVEAAHHAGPRAADWTIPLRLDPTTNGGAFKRGLVGCAARHRRAVAAALAAHLRTVARFRDALDAGEPLACTITRLGGGAMDDDNLPPTGKWVRDTVALFLGVDDGPTGPITWAYRQEPGGPWGVRVRLERRAT